MNPDDQARVSDMLHEYETALVKAAPLATENEQQLYTLHLDELRRLRELLVADAPTAAIVDLLMTERRAYGWAYLSGALGERAEQCFYVVMATFRCDVTS